MDQFLAAVRFVSTPCPCFPGAPELIASHTTPSFEARAPASTRDPLVWAATTYGQPGLNHSRTTTFPL